MDPRPVPLREVGATLLARVPVGRQELDVYDAGEVGWVAHQPGVAASDETEEIPERFLPFMGYLVPMGISIREANGLVEPSQGDAAQQPHVRGICRWQVTMSGEVVYSPRDQPLTVRDALLQAGGALQALVAQMERTGIRWWDERTWRGRAVWYQGVEALVMAHDPMRGTMLLVPEAAVMGDPEVLVRDFPRTPEELQFGAQDRPMHGVWVDMLDPTVGWSRTRTHVPIDTPEDTGVVPSVGDPSSDQARVSPGDGRTGPEPDDGSDITADGGVDDQRGPDQDRPDDQEGAAGEG